MGEVYKARDTRLDRTVAVKVASHIAAREDLRSRFEREARPVSSSAFTFAATLATPGQRISLLMARVGQLRWRGSARAAFFLRARFLGVGFCRVGFRAFVHWNKFTSRLRAASATPLAMRTFANCDVECRRRWSGIGIGRTIAVR